MKKEINLSAKERYNLIAESNRNYFKKRKWVVSNIIGSPGCGKTAMLEYMVNNFCHPFAVIIGDVKTALDADRIINSGNRLSFAIETGGACHLSPVVIEEKLPELANASIDYLFIENVGNLVCPASFDLGEDFKVAVLSIPEGDEKVRKYPALFVRAQVVLINKIDLLPYFSYDLERVKQDCLAQNPNVNIFPVSAKTGAGMADWLNFLTGLAKK